MNSKVVISAAVAGFMSAFCVMSTFSGGFIGLLVGLFAPVPLFYAALIGGLTASGVATLVGFGLLALALSPILSVGFYLVGMAAVPAYLGVLREGLWRKAGSVYFDGRFIGRHLAYVALIGGIAIGLLLLNLDGQLANQGGLEGVARQMLGALADQIAAGSKASNADLAVMRERIMDLSESVFLLSGAVWTIVMAFSAALAARLATGKYGFEGAELAGVVTPRWMAIAIAATLILGFSAGVPGLVFAVIAWSLVAAAFIHGMSVLHSITKHVRMRGFILSLAYGICFFFNTVGLVPALLGLVDSRLDLRQRFAGRT